jgi:preprotein translocase subunit SecA
MLLSKQDLEQLELTQKQFSSSIVRAQKQMEARHFGIRKHLFDYDSVIDRQRQRIYSKRDQILHASGDDIAALKDEMREFIPAIVLDLVSTAKTVGMSIEDLCAQVFEEFGVSIKDQDI